MTRVYLATYAGSGCVNFPLQNRCDNEISPILPFTEDPFQF